MNVYLRIILVILFIFVLGLILRKTNTHSQKYNTKSTSGCLWEICSIDTMKTSRDMARAELNNPAFDNTIQREIKAIKETGANYVAIGTPYDSEFLPYLKRWVKTARDKKLSVWFRGNWSNWEGWFEYSKNLSPDEHIQKTARFIKDNPDLFVDGDIFDACPECENAGHWPQPQKDESYNVFLRDQEKSLRNAFGNIKKRVITNYPSIIGGRAKEVLSDNTVSTLNKTVTIDHYFKDPENISEYIIGFKDKYNAKTLVSETGAPIPDMHGNMTEDEQAQFMTNVLERMYLEGDSISGLNYWVLSNGTTALLNTDGSKRKVYGLLTKYYTPGIITGVVKNTLGEPLPFLPIITSDGVLTHTDKNGSYIFKIPQRKLTISTESNVYENKNSSEINITYNSQNTIKNFELTPKNPSFLYKIRLFIKHMLRKDVF